MKYSESQLPLLPNSFSKIEIRKEYLHIPEPEFITESKHTWWLLSLVPEGEDLLIKKVTLLSGEPVSQEIFTYEETLIETKNLLKNGTSLQDVQVYTTLRYSIFEHREKKIEKILIEKGILHKANNDNGGNIFGVYFNTNRKYGAFPLLQFNNNCGWELIVCHPKKDNNYRDLISTTLMTISWNDEKGLRRAFNLIMDEAGYRNLEIQAVMSRGKGLSDF